MVWKDHAASGKDMQHNPASGAIRGQGIDNDLGLLWSLMGMGHWFENSWVCEYGLSLNFVICRFSFSSTIFSRRVNSLICTIVIRSIIIIIQRTITTTNVSLRIGPATSRYVVSQFSLSPTIRAT